MTLRRAFLLAVCLAAQGCTTRAWYEGFKTGERQQCYKRISQDEIQQCLDRVNGTTYDDYQKARKEARSRDK